MKNLIQARKKGDLETFIKEREERPCPKGDLDKLDAVIKLPDQGKSKEAQEASKKKPSGD
jgi:hypothetical protein